MRVSRTVGFVVTLGALSAAALYARDHWVRADLGEAYVAKTMCSCVLVSGRTLESCRAELLDDADIVRVAADERGMTATILGGLMARRSTYDPHFGCAPADAAR